MPSRSPAQARLMAAVAHDPKFAKRVGIKQSVGREFNAADQRRKGMADGGAVDPGTETIQPTPRSGALGTMADALKWLRDNADKFSGAVSPYTSRLNPLSALAAQAGLGDKLGSFMVGKAPEELNELSYGNAPAQVTAAAYPGVGSYVPQFKPGRAESALDAVFAGQAALPLAQGAARAGEGALSALGRAAVEHNPFPAAPLSGRPAAMAVRTKGGNFEHQHTDNMLGDLDRGLYDESSYEGEPPTTVWANKQLKNYIAKEMGTPADPLLSVEKDYPNLHLPEGGVYGRLAGVAEDPARMATLRQFAAQGQHGTAEDLATIQRHQELTGGRPMTPWESHVNDNMFSMNPAEYREFIDAYGEPPAWIDKLAPDAQIWSLKGNGVGEQLGFGHVLDYLDAAQSAHKWQDVMRTPDFDPALMTRPEQTKAALHNAGLSLSPEQVARTSVADAVRKTAAWNKFMAENQFGPADPDLARGIAAVHKEYPEEGMRWVKLGMPEGAPPPWKSGDPLPEGTELRPTRGGGWLATVKDSKGNLVDEYGGRTQEEAMGYAHPNAELAAGLNAEGNAMGHCVGGYCEDVANRGTEIYSLRDKNNNPHVTVETSPGRNDRPEWISKYATPEQRASLDETAYQAWKAAGGAPSDIIQIKGKQNAAPVDKYLPFVQDFVRSGQWGRVGDLSNTGLRDVRGLYKPDYAAQVESKLGKRFVTDEELNAFSKQDKENWERTQGYARGGSVHHNRKAALLARL